MKSLIYTVFVIYVLTTLAYFLQMPIVLKLKMMELLGVGIILAKFSIDYFKNRKSSDSYLKYALYSGFAFLVFTSALFFSREMPVSIKFTLLLLSLLAFSMIGFNDSLKSLKLVNEKSKKTLAYFYILIFAIHGLYAFVVASAFLKNYEFQNLIPGMIIFDLLVLLPFIIYKKAFEQYVLVGLFVVSMSINTYLYMMIQSPAG